jgi:hypothetical protein
MSEVEVRLLQLRASKVHALQVQTGLDAPDIYAVPLSVRTFWASQKTSAPVRGTNMSCLDALSNGPFRPPRSVSAAQRSKRPFSSACRSSLIGSPHRLPTASGCGHACAGSGFLRGGLRLLLTHCSLLLHTLQMVAIVHEGGRHRARDE